MRRTRRRPGRVDGRDRVGRRADDLAGPVDRQRAALAERHHDEVRAPLEESARCTLGMVRHAREHRGLDLVHDQDVDRSEQVAGDRAGGCRVEDAEGLTAPATRNASSTASSGTSSWARAGPRLDARCRGADDGGRARAVGTRRHDDRVLAAGIERDRGESRRSVRVHAGQPRSDAGRGDGTAAARPSSSFPTAPMSDVAALGAPARPPGSPPCRRSPGSCRARAPSRRAPAAGRRGGTGRR